MHLIADSFQAGSPFIAFAVLTLPGNRIGKTIKAHIFLFQKMLQTPLCSESVIPNSLPVWFTTAGIFCAGLYTGKGSLSPSISGAFMGAGVSGEVCSAERGCSLEAGAGINPQLSSRIFSLLSVVLRSAIFLASNIFNKVKTNIGISVCTGLHLQISGDAANDNSLCHFRSFLPD